MTTCLPLLLAVPFFAATPADVGHQDAAPVPVVEEPAPPLVMVLPPAREFVPFVRAPAPSLAPAARAMIEEAIRSDDSEAVAAVVKVALKTQPYDEGEIRAMHRAFLDRKAQALAARTEAEIKRIREADVLELWKGQVELGAFRSTGNTSNFGVSGAVRLNRKGIDWEHIVQLTADYQEDRGAITREQYLASYQPRYTLRDGLFTYARAQYERDRIQGYTNRATLSGGLGYRVLSGKSMTLSVEAGPAVRQTDFVTEPTQMTWSTLTSLDFDWQISKSVKLMQDASGYVETGNSTFTSATALEAGMGKGLKAKISYAIEHETSPPAGALKTDTISRFSLVYGF